ncbi:acyl carrier protein [Mycolicibacterium peregrinum]
MDETQSNSNLPEGTQPAGAPAPRPDLTVAEMREWLRKAVATATSQSPDAIDETTPLIELGLSSRDAVAMASDIEDLTGVTLTATVLFRHPTIESLATVIIEGEPEPPSTDDEDWSRTAT